MKTELTIHGTNSGQYALVMDGEKVALMMGNKETALKNAKIIKQVFDTSGRLDHLRQQLEANRDYLSNADNDLDRGARSAFKQAISLIDQLKAETKNNKTMETPRRIRLDLNKPAELAIYNAMQEVEKLPADVRLTQAVIKLQEAKNLVADFIDSQIEVTKNT